jgi:hypothetical protein
MGNKASLLGVKLKTATWTYDTLDMGATLGVRISGEIVITAGGSAY